MKAPGDGPLGVFVYEVAVRVAQLEEAVGARAEARSGRRTSGWA